MELAARVRALRMALDLTQDAVGSRAGHERHARVYLSKIERGDNQVSSWRAREQLARGFGLGVDALVAYLEGRSSLEDTVALARSGASVRPEAAAPTPALAGQGLLARLEVAAIQGFDAQRHTPEELDAVRAVLRRVPENLLVDAELRGVARRCLDGASALRRQGVAVSAEALLLVVLGALPPP